MIPTEEQAKSLWEKYQLPEKKRVHSQLISSLALFFANRIINHLPVSINIPLLEAGCLLHDIDKNISPEVGEKHPQTGVRILKEEGMNEVAELIKNHSVQNIENAEKAPKTWEEKLLFLSDKMVKQEIIGVDKRFELWQAEEDLPDEQKQMLTRVHPLVKALEKEIFSIAQINLETVANLEETI